MRRRLVNSCTVLSLLLFVCVAVFWVRSYMVTDARSFHRDHPQFREFPTGPVYYELRLESGEVSLLAIRGIRERRTLAWLGGPGPIIPPGPFNITTLTLRRYGPLTLASGTGSMRFGSDLRGPVVAPAVPFKTTSLAFWFPALLALSLPGIRLWRRHRRSERRARLAAAGRCLSCGYDLTGNLSGACPECGEALPTRLKPGSPVTAGGLERSEVPPVDVPRR